jgi:hypothetical protein
VVGYLENYKADTSYVIVHDNWPNTPKNIAIPWLPNKVSSWFFIHVPEIPDLTVSGIYTLVDTTKGYTDSLWVDQPVTVDLKIRNLGSGGAGAYIVEVAVGWGRDSIDVSFDSLFTPTESGIYTISSAIHWDQNTDGNINDPPDNDVSNDTLSVKVNVYVESTSLDEERLLIEDFHLFQNRPNPFNPSTVITWQLAISSQVELSIFNILGEKVTTLVSEKKVAGYHSIEWDASNFAGGIYYYQIKAGEFRDVKKMVLIK